MAQTSRELVTRCLKFEYPERVPRQLWQLPWAEKHLKATLDEIARRFPSDIGGLADVYRPSPRKKGDPYVVGHYVDEWGCAFVNIQEGVHGEVKAPIIKDVREWKQVRPPYEILPENPGKARDEVNRFCAKSELFLHASACPRPWERLQFLRGTQNAMVDVMEPDGGIKDLLRVIHEFHLKELEFWVKTDVDGIPFMDDWGSQTQLLIPPPVWRDLFKPLYKDYCDIAHAHGKFVFMHSDGHIREIYPDLIEIGVDAVNSQLFCMDMAELARIAKGKITFWGEIDRQHALPAKDPQVGRDAVRKVARHLYDPAGGVIAQFELTVGSHGPTAIAIFEEWEKVGAAGLAKAGGASGRDEKKKGWRRT